MQSPILWIVASSAAARPQERSAYHVQSQMPSRFWKRYRAVLASILVPVFSVLVAAQDSDSSYQGGLSDTDKITILTRENAQQLVSGFRGVEVEYRRSIDQTHFGSALPLRGLDDLSPGVAQVLAKYPHALILRLTRISDEAAEQLRHHKSFLVIDGVRDLSPVAAKALAGYRGFSLNLNDLVSLSPEAAIAFAGSDFFLAMNSLPEISGESAEALSRRKGKLELNGLTSLSDRAAEAFARYNGNRLTLRGLKSVSDRGIAALKGNESLWIPDEF